MTNQYEIILKVQYARITHTHTEISYKKAALTINNISFIIIYMDVIAIQMINLMVRFTEL